MAELDDDTGAIDPMGSSTVGSGTVGFDDTATTVTERRRRPDPVALLVGLLTLGMAVAAFVGQVPDLSGLDPRWLLAGGALALGLMLLVGSLRGRRDRTGRSG